MQRALLGVPLCCFPQIGARLLAAAAPRGARDQSPRNPAHPPQLQIADGVFVWDETAEEPSLKDVNIDVPPGSLTMVVGGVGSGKSSVLSAVIGQMERTRGDVAVGGRVAYVAQTAWIINDSVQARAGGRGRMAGGRCMCGAGGRLRVACRV